MEGTDLGEFTEARGIMEGAGRVFAGEYCQARDGWSEPSGPGLITPGGMRCRLLFVAGTLTEKVQHPHDLFYGRVADPTGVFEIRAVRPDAGLQEDIARIGTPAFVTVLGCAKMTAGRPGATPYLELLEIREVDRATRDSWIVRTAELTCGRLALLKEAIQTGHRSGDIAAALAMFGTGLPFLGTMAEMVAQALDQVADPSEQEQRGDIVKEEVLSIIRDSAGKKGVPLDELILRAGNAGIDEAAVRQAVRVLLEEDECYQPAREVYKPL